MCYTLLMRKYIAAAERQTAMSENTHEELLQSLAEKASALEPELFSSYLAFLEELLEHQAGQ